MYEPKAVIIHYLLTVYFVFDQDQYNFDFLEIMANNKIMELAISYHWTQSKLNWIAIRLKKIVDLHDQCVCLDAPNEDEYRVKAL